MPSFDHINRYLDYSATALASIVALVKKALSTDRDLASYLSIESAKLETNCPKCRAVIQVPTATCPYCAVGISVSLSGNELIYKEIEAVTCKQCSGSIDRGSLNCKHCGSKISGEAVFSLEGFQAFSSDRECFLSITPSDPLLACQIVIPNNPITNKRERGKYAIFFSLGEKGEDVLRLKFTKQDISRIKARLIVSLNAIPLDLDMEQLIHELNGRMQNGQFTISVPDEYYTEEDSYRKIVIYSNCLSEAIYQVITELSETIH